MLFMHHNGWSKKTIFICYISSNMHKKEKKEISAYLILLKIRFLTVKVRMWYSCAVTVGSVIRYLHVIDPRSLFECSQSYSYIVWCKNTMLICYKAPILHEKDKKKISPRFMCYYCWCKSITFIYYGSSILHENKRKWKWIPI